MRTRKCLRGKRKTLAAHASDERPTIYSLYDLLHARTDDDVWNAAQRRLLLDGWMHNNLRMYWVKQVNELMDARRAVKAAKANADSNAIKLARAAVERTKRALGERGPTWWDDGTDFNRFLLRNTPYAEWWEAVTTED